MSDSTKTTDSPASGAAGGYAALEWQNEPPPNGSFFYVRHYRMNPTMGMRVGDRLVLFGESVVQAGRYFGEMPEGTEYWGPLPEPEGPIARAA